MLRHTLQNFIHMKPKIDSDV